MLEVSNELLKVDHLKKFLKTLKGYLLPVNDVSFLIGLRRDFRVVGESGWKSTLHGKSTSPLYPEASRAHIGEGLFLW